MKVSIHLVGGNNGKCWCWYGVGLVLVVVLIVFEAASFSFSVGHWVILL